MKILSVLGILFLMASSGYAAPATTVHIGIGKVSEVVFPEKVAKIIKGGASDSVLVEVADNSVYILPKTTTPSDIFVTGESGQSYPLNLTLAGEHDVKVEIGGGAAVQRQTQDINIDTMDLMKDLLRGQEPAGAALIKGNTSILLADGQIKLTVETVYDFPHISAYILKAQNLIDNQVIIPIEQMTFPHLLAVSSDRDSLSAKGRANDSSKVYVIAGK